MANGRCRMHGGKAGRPPIHGRYTKKRIAARRKVRECLRALRELLDEGAKQIKRDPAK